MTAPTPLDFPDAMLVPVDPTEVTRLLNSLDLSGDGIGKRRPDWGSDIVWLSAADESTFKLFEQAFERMKVGDHVRDRLDLDDAPRLFAGSVIRRSRCDAPHFHTDWRSCKRQAFTFITAADDDSAGFGLLYHDRDGLIVSYDYRPGEGILFGDEFRHSTRPGASDSPVTLLCFEFGTDKMRYWRQIYSCIAGQSMLVRRPDGRLVAGIPPQWSRWRSRVARRLPRLARLVKALVR